MKYDDKFNIEIDDTLYYGTVFGDKKREVKCDFCGKTHFYSSCEMIFRHNNYVFCGYACRSKWRKKHPNAKPHNPYTMSASKYTNL